MIPKNFLIPEENMADSKQMYRTVMDDHFPERMISVQQPSFGLPKEAGKSGTNAGQLIEKGLRYGRTRSESASTN
jgi:phosphoribosylaminoimidazolecarboxamide formyltransferase/IMP cyclohydrolase